MPGTSGGNRVSNAVVARVGLGVDVYPDTNPGYPGDCVSCRGYGYGRTAGLSRLSHPDPDGDGDCDMSGMSGMSDVNADTDTASVVSVVNADGDIDRRSSSTNEDASVDGHASTHGNTVLSADGAAGTYRGADGRADRDAGTNTNAGADQHASAYGNALLPAHGSTGPVVGDGKKSEDDFRIVFASPQWRFKKVSNGEGK